MNFAFTEDQEELRATVRAFLEHHHPMDRTRAAAAADGFAAATWERMVSEMELTSLSIDPDHGGAGATFVEVGVAVEELGRVLVPVPYLPTVVVAAVIAAADAASAARWLPGISDGARATLALDAGALEISGAGDDVVVDGDVPHVPDGHVSDLILLAARRDGEPTLLVVDTGDPGVAAEPQPTLDQTRRQAILHLRSASASALPSDSAGSGVDHARQLLGVALACEAVGAAAHTLAFTLEHLKQRVQFGRPLAAFQALKHRCADLAVLLESARSTAYYAAWAVDGAPGELHAVAPVAQLVCGEALRHIAGESIQLHGGIGFTWEHDAHLFFKRAKANQLLFGSPAQLRGVIGREARITEAVA